MYKSHLETLDLGKEKLSKVPVEHRSFTSIMMPTNVDKIPEAKNIIREFEDKMEALLKQGEVSDLYQMSIQLYPMTTLSKVKDV